MRFDLQGLARLGGHPDTMRRATLQQSYLRITATGRKTVPLDPDEWPRFSDHQLATKS